MVETLWCVCGWVTSRRPVVGFMHPARDGKVGHGRRELWLVEWDGEMQGVVAGRAGGWDVVDGLWFWVDEGFLLGCEWRMGLGN